MITILGKTYITDKECSKRFGFSQVWFKNKRIKNLPPPYIKVNGKILYELNEIDNWFKSKMIKF